MDRSTPASLNRARSRLALLLSVVMGLLAAGLPAFATTVQTTITVCPSGPPTCDFAAIQPALDAAAPGDTVLVSPGTYSGTINLPSQVVLESSQGAGVTEITAGDGPIIQAAAVFSTTLRGFTIRGGPGISNAIGVQLAAADLTIEDSQITDIVGRAGNESQPSGGDAVGIWLTEASSLQLRNTFIQSVTGGDALDYRGGGGDVTGLRIDGGGEVELIHAFVTDMTGGEPNQIGPCYGDDEGGGDAIGVAGMGGATLKISDVVIAELDGGGGCFDVLGNYSGSGEAGAIKASESTVVVEDSLLNDIKGFGIRTSDSDAVTITRSTISDIGGSGSGIASDSDEALLIQGNHLEYLGRGITVEAGERAVISRNVVRRAGSPCGFTYDRDVVGIRVFVLGGGVGRLDGNVIADLAGADCSSTPFGSGVGGGGDAIGISISGHVTLTNNVVWSLQGGTGGNAAIFWNAGNGGSAIALYVDPGSAVQAWNNAFHLTEPGLGGSGDPDGSPGLGAGIYLSEDAATIALNNTLTEHEHGLFAAPGSALQHGYNNLWLNGTDYEGVEPGFKDRHLEPRFVDPGDWWSDTDYVGRLAADSPLIDAGINVALTLRDVDNQPRLMDGDGDGFARADIGADEFWPGTLHNSLSVDKVTALPGDVLSYTIRLINPSLDTVQSDVTLTDTLPVGSTYVPGSLTATSGVAGQDGSLITWQGDIAPLSTVTVTFSVLADLDWTAPHALTNLTVVSDGATVAASLQVSTLVNPIKTYLPASAATYGFE